jgi:hypothetical protein
MELGNPACIAYTSMYLHNKIVGKPLQMNHISTITLNRIKIRIPCLRTPKVNSIYFVLCQKGSNTKAPTVVVHTSEIKIETCTR